MSDFKRPHNGGTHPFAGGARIASAMRAPDSPQLLIFTSNCVVAHRHVEDIMPFLQQKGIEPVVFLTPDSKSPRANIPSLRTYCFYEEGLVNDTIYPALEAMTVDMKDRPRTPGQEHPGPHPWKGGQGVRISPARTFNEVQRRYSFTATPIDSLKDPVVMEAVRSKRTIGAVSTYQDAIFKPDLIEAVQERGFFWNLHPGLLPESKGMYVAFWNLLAGKREHGYSLHEVDAGIDTGGLIGRREGTLSPSKSVVQSYIEFTPLGSSLLLDALGKKLDTGKIEILSSSHGDGNYFSFPTEDDINHAWEQGVRLWGTKSEMVKTYAGIYGMNDFLESRIRSAIDSHEHPSGVLETTAQATTQSPPVSVARRRRTSSIPPPPGIATRRA